MVPLPARLELNTVRSGTSTAARTALLAKDTAAVSPVTPGPDGEGTVTPALPVTAKVRVARLPLAVSDALVRLNVGLLGSRFPGAVVLILNAWLVRSTQPSAVSAAMPDGS